MYTSFLNRAVLGFSFLVLAGCQATAPSLLAPPPPKPPKKVPPWKISQPTLEAPTSDKLWEMLLRARKTRKDLREQLKKVERNEEQLEKLMAESIDARLEFQKAVRRTNESEYQKFYVSMDGERKRRAAPTSVFQKR